MTVLITGVAGFIGMHVAIRLLQRGETVVGVDSLNDYYDRTLKSDRLRQLLGFNNFEFRKVDISNQADIFSCFSGRQIVSVVHLAAQAGVRYSLENPAAYVESNLVGFANILECCRQVDVSHLVYASSSSVYGGNRKQPFHEMDSVDRPVSFYAATKKANELMAYSYSHLFAMPTTGLRFFTVYGPWGRPDMAYFLFTKAILANETIDIFNNGNMIRDFTYIDDIVEGVCRVLKNPPVRDAGAPALIFNIGNSRPVRLMDFIESIENVLKLTARKRFLPMQDGDVLATCADVSALADWIGFHPDTELVEGIEKFILWFRGYYNV